MTLNSVIAFILRFSPNSIALLAEYVAVVEYRPTGWPKNGTVIWYALTSSNINRFSKLFHSQNQEKTCNKTITKIPPHLKCVGTLPCEVSSVLKATIENKTHHNNTFLRN